MIRLIHTSDLHLDSEFSCNDPKLTSLRKKEQRALFANLMRYVRDQKADVLLISGDLFDKKQPEKETAEVVLREFRNTPETEIFIAAGRSDCCRPGSFLYETEFPPKVHVFREEALSSFSVDRLHLTVYGYSFCHRNLTKNPFAVMPPVDKSRFNLLCGTGSLSLAPDCCPITAEELAHSGVDYAALGGSHEAGELCRIQETYYAYSGSPEGLVFEDKGPKSIRIAAMEKTEGGLLFQSKTVRFGRRQFDAVELSAEGLTDAAPLAAELSEYTKKEGYGLNTLLKVTVSGRVPGSFRLPKQLFSRLEERLGCLVIEDQTILVPGKEEKADDFRSVFAEKVCNKIKDEELRSQVLKCGFAALEDQRV